VSVKEKRSLREVSLTSCEVGCTTCKRIRVFLWSGKEQSKHLKKLEVAL
jgi:hypothetical protein